MIGVLLRCLVALAVAAGSASAADFWEKKKYTEWSRKEVQKMLNDSPWARPVEFHPPAGGGDDEDKPGRAICEGCSGGSRRSGAPDLQQSVLVTVRWQSALPVKQAMVRGRFGDEAANSPEAAKFLERQEPYYVVAVVGIPAHVLSGSPERFKAGARLKLKNKPPLPAADVRAEPYREHLATVYFAFPRTQQGAPSISLEDAEVEFALELGSNDIEKKFRLKEMVFDGKLEL